MPYWVKGTAQQIFHAFGQDSLIAEQKNDTKTILRDVPAVHFWGSLQQAITHFKIWATQALGKFYLQGDMTAGNLAFLFGPDPLKKVGEASEVCHANLVRQNFAYINDAGENCGLLVMYRKDDPTQWVMALEKNGHAAPKDRALFCLSSFDLTPSVKVPNSGLTVSLVPSLDPLLVQIGSTLPSVLLQKALNGDNTINLRFQRIALLMRKLQVEQETVTLRGGPIPFSDLNLPALFADNPALDKILHYKIQDELSLSAVVLKDLLSESSPLCKEIQALKLTDDERINKSLLKTLIVFYEKGLLEENRELLANFDLIKKFSAFMWNETQIKLLPFLLEQNYTDEEIRGILAKDEYYQALNKLVDLEPALALKAKRFFNDPTKLEELRFIHSFPDEDCKMLCLIFWVKGDLSEDGYQRIFNAAQDFPLMASSLVALDQTKTIDIGGLEQHASNPHLYLQDSIRHHFDKELKECEDLELKLFKLTSPELQAANMALLLLKKSGGITPQEYQLVLEKDAQGQALRLFLPQLVNIKDDAHRKTLIKVLYSGVIHGIQTQGNQILQLADPQQRALAEDLRERFTCVTLMQKLKMFKMMVEFAAQEDEEAKRFRQVLLRVEAQCKVISERLAGSETYQPMRKDWEKAQEAYRRKLYTMAYEALMDPEIDVRERLRGAEKVILDIVDPQMEPGNYKTIMDALIVLANIVITVLSVFSANAIKYKVTGNLWFFNQTTSGEEIRALDKEVLELVEPEKKDENGIWSMISSFQLS
ncbi:hypothetical protein OQJ26_09945 [Legionella sp. PATHC038]|uniref:hypothetical protein n=1 Tax=Legionella sheltonii TaxID=2992041 RepID=UPI002243593B|nr:hypothetical protein [Legionella sp. PATHC038]MCW8399113.1 hypothetical protein [Legionella sp. PATHC038]